MNKTVFLNITGDDYSALHFEQNFNKDEVYKEMLEEGVTFKSFTGDEYYIEVRIIEFGEIDEKFIKFVRGEFISYDASKDRNIYRVV